MKNHQSSGLARRVLIKEYYKSEGCQEGSELQGRSLSLQLVIRPQNCLPCPLYTVCVIATEKGIHFLPQKLVLDCILSVLCDYSLHLQCPYELTAWRSNSWSVSQVNIRILWIRGIGCRIYNSLPLLILIYFASKWPYKWAAFLMWHRFSNLRLP